ncbi:hypothetical protein CTI12_AA347190 [Artemisia annua]|uniref:Retrotransposon gag domain-containing protein n=1 Tax=Artemisia annua TaxID=35608 RepID=A0A2U1MS66_ARTAN|nr:hypothetical protein CTI12_AA347190 [Artemisia annua]
MVSEPVAAAIPQILETLQNTDEARNNNEGIHVWIERFNKLKPLSFKSAATPTEAEDWITYCEKMFHVVGCPNGVKTRLTTFKLEGDALNRWKAHVRAKGDNYAETCTWAVFRETFYKRYIPFSEQQRYEREYGSIHQLERENSAEYMERFLRLASFVGPTVMGDAQRQARHYKWGLKHWVLDRIVNTEYEDVSMLRRTYCDGDAQDRLVIQVGLRASGCCLTVIVTREYEDVSMVCNAASNIEVGWRESGGGRKPWMGIGYSLASSGQARTGSDHRGRS